AMLLPALSPSQFDLLERPLTGRLFIEGTAGCGKTTAGVARLRQLLAGGVPAGSVLVLVPQRTLAGPYYDSLLWSEAAAGGVVNVSTVGGLAQRMVDLFWPLAAEPAGFAHPDRPPTFLTLETAQYFMARLVGPQLAEGRFEPVTIDRNRLYSQILDNLNKAAVVGFPHTEIGSRLKAAWIGEPAQARVYDDAQLCATQFREYCLAHNLLDFSLQLEVFRRHLWTLPLCREYLLETYRHLIVDNVQEDTPAAHDLLADWLPHCRSALLICDHEAGFRRFLGADPQGAGRLRELCDQRLTFDRSHIASPALLAFGTGLRQALRRSTLNVPTLNVSTFNVGMGSALVYEYHRFYPQMLDWVAEQIGRLVEQGTPPGEIVVLAPFVSDALRFSLFDRLAARGVPARSHRPSRSLHDEPAARCLLALAALAHPDWGAAPARFDVAYALVQAIDDLDLVRGQLLAEILYRFREGAPTLTSFDDLKPEMQQRITYRLGGRYEGLRLWLAEREAGPAEELDHFLGRLFGELLSRPGYRFHRDYDAGEVAASLIESAQKFRLVAGQALREAGVPPGREYLAMVRQGVIAAQYLARWRAAPEDAVLLAPAHTFLMRNRAVDYQFWLNVGGPGWFQRLYQPLTHPYVLSREWPAGRQWTDEEEYAADRENLYRITIGLIRRCRRGVYLGLSELGEQGFEQQSALLRIIQRLMQQLPLTTYHLPIPANG
ncbi:MAG: hypothetical protein HY784_19030, partial [Chloroflexi bacterium]|nr:hypothetical protein [Chloroflexota bacterium]